MVGSCIPHGPQAPRPSCYMGHIGHELPRIFWPCMLHCPIPQSWGQEAEIEGGSRRLEFLAPVAEGVIRGVAPRWESMGQELKALRSCIAQCLDSPDLCYTALAELLQLHTVFRCQTTLCLQFLTFVSLNWIQHGLFPFFLSSCMEMAPNYIKTCLINNSCFNTYLLFPIPKLLCDYAWLQS